MICSNHLNTATGGIEDCLHRNERRTWQVIVLTLSMMIVEISAGTIFGSMALLADGWHMGTHAAALGITVYWPTVCLVALVDARDAPGWSLSNETPYWIVCCAIAAWGVWGLVSVTTGRQKS